MADAYKKDLLVLFNAGGSMVVADPKQGLTAEPLKGAELASAIEAADKNLKDRFRCYYVTDEHKEPDEKQPFPIIVAENGKPLVYALIEGEFEKYDTDGASLGPEATFMEDWLANKVQGIFSSCSGSVKKLFQLIDSASCRKDFQEEMGSRGVVVLINNDEAPLWISKGNAEEAGKFTWGEASNKLTYTEPKAKDDKPAKVDLSKMSYKDRKAYLKEHPEAADGAAAPVAAPAATPDKPAEPAKPSVPTIPADVELEKVTDTGAIGIKKGRRYLFPPALNLEDRKKWYGKHGGSSKDYDWKNNVGIPIDKIVRSSHFWAMVNGPDTKDTDAHGPITKADRIILTGPEIGEAFTVINKSTGYATVEDLYATIDEQHPTFTVRLGKTLDSWPNLMRLPEADLLKMSHKALASLTHDLRIAHVKLNPAAFGGTQVIAAPEKDKEPVKVEEKVDEKVDISKLSYKERKEYLKAHPEAATAA